MSPTSYRTAPPRARKTILNTLAVFASSLKREEKTGRTDYPAGFPFPVEGRLPGLPGRGGPVGLGPFGGFFHSGFGCRGPLRSWGGGAEPTFRICGDCAASRSFCST